VFPVVIIIILDRLYFMLSYRLAPIDAASVHHGSRVLADKPQAIQPGHTLHQEWAQKPHGQTLSGLLVYGHLPCSEPRHQVSQDWTCPWNLVCGLLLASLGRACSRLRCGSYAGPTSQGAAVNIF
jgi:hypothetical protein